MTSPDSTRASHLVALVCAEQRVRWERGDHVPVEDLLTNASLIAADPDAVLDVICNEMALRSELNLTVDRDEFLQRFPMLAEPLRALLELFSAFEITDDLAEVLDVDLPLDDPVSSASAVEPSTKLSSRQLTVDDAEVVLAQTAPFQDLPLPVLTALAQECVPRQFEDGQKLMQQGEAAHSLMILTCGQAEVHMRDSDGADVFLATCEPRCVIGEIGVLTREPRSADIIATQPSSVLEIPFDAYRDVAEQFPALNALISQQISERLGDKERDALCGKTCGDYRIRQRLGRGTMGVVYRGWQLSTDRTVALKMMRHDLVYDPNAVRRFRQESEILRQLQHPNIVQLYDEFPAFNTVFLVMEFCDGVPLSTIIEQDAPLSLDDVRAIVGQLAAALAYAHDSDVVHRDLKPSNVLINRDGTLKLTDFGLARSLVDTSLTTTGQIIGTPRYMSREQLMGEPVDANADIYALGCIAWELLTGRPLFPATDILNLMAQQLSWSLPSRTDIRDDLEHDLFAVLQSGLQSEPANRDVDLSELARWASPFRPE